MTLHTIASPNPSDLFSEGMSPMGYKSLLSSSSESSFAFRLAERKLLLAVLERAIYDYLFEKDSQLSENAKNWLFESDTPASRDVFPFDDLCEYLQLSKSRILNKLKSLKSNKNKGLINLRRALARDRVRTNRGSSYLKLV